ncbi:sugar-binding protein [Opitutaceae bacterium TAV5]|nr:sugar-binding protein [Opitutaceae bacterium TAV5]
MAVCAFLASAILAIAVTAADTAPQELLLSDFEIPHAQRQWLRPSNPRKSPLEYVSIPERVKQGKTSGRWSDLPVNKHLQLADVPVDWSAYEALVFWLYSETNNGQQLSIVLTSPRSTDIPDDRSSYYRHTFTVDWTGWRQVVVPFTRFAPNKSPGGWSRITRFVIYADGWKGSALPDTVLYFDDMKLVAR